MQTQGTSAVIFFILHFLLVYARMRTEAHPFVHKQIYAHQYLLYAYTYIEAFVMFNSTGTVLGLGQVVSFFFMQVRP